MSERVSRRTVLQGLAGCVGAAAVDADSDAERDEHATDGDEGRIPAPFDAIPTADDAPEDVRSIARVNYPPEAVLDTGPIPDPRHQHLVERELVVPAWGLDAARWRLQCRLDCEDPDAADTPAELPEWRIEEALMGYAQLRERFVTPDGRDAVDVLQEGLEEGDHAE